MADCDDEQTLFIDDFLGVEIGKFLLIYIYNFHVLNNLLLIFIYKLDWQQQQQEVRKKRKKMFVVLISLALSISA
jgi:hypothetical protein